ncbi:hypothetical protein ACR77J_07365 [Tissierella praeacuta]|uniref:hypothetical protein n=1 Tax=Tissierella praeacuta TaxID=43131 RepID=UPI003DA451AE
MKKTVKTTVKKYDENGKLLEHTETIVEEEVREKDYMPLSPYKPWNPFETPAHPNPYTPYVGDVWNHGKREPHIYTNEGSQPMTVTYDEQV